MELQEYITVLRQRWLTVLVSAALVTGAAVAYCWQATPLYRASTSVFFSIRSGQTPAELAQGLNYTQNQVQSYTEVATSPLVLQPVIDDLGLDRSPKQLAAAISAKAPINTVIINITVSDPDPAKAADIANAVGQQLSKVVGKLAPESGQGEPIRVTTLAPAVEPSVPASPRVKLIVAVAAVLGLLLGAVLAIVRAVLDTRVGDETDVRKVTLSPVIGSIELASTLRHRSPALRQDPHGRVAESFRQLRTNLQFLNLDNPARSIVVTSPLPGEGKTTTALNVAMALAEAHVAVLLIDADLRRPSIANITGLEGTAGLTTLLAGEAKLDELTQPYGQSGYLDVLCSGHVPANPSELLGSHRMEALLKEACEHYEMVLLDTAPLLPVTDGALLSKLADGAIIVVRHNKSRRPQLAEAHAMLTTVGARLLGVVFNGVPSKAAPTYERRAVSSRYRFRNSFVRRWVRARGWIPSRPGRTSRDRVDVALNEERQRNDGHRKEQIPVHVAERDL